MIALFVALAFLAPATFACLFYVVLTYLGRRRAIAIPLEPQTAFVVLIPAHNEALSITETLRSVLDADYPAALRRIVVVADNCSDHTADVVREHGAEVLERRDLTLRGKGYALAYGFDCVLPSRPDAVVVLDADCEVFPDLFRIFDAHLRNGSPVVQAAVVTRNPGPDSAGFASAIGSIMDNEIAAGKDAIGLRPPLRGTGMGFARSILERFPWNAFGLTEDAEYDHRLARAGVKIRFLASAIVHSEAPVRTVDLFQQRRRWRASLFVGSGILTRWIESKPLVLAQWMLTSLVVIATVLCQLVPDWFILWAGAIGLFTFGMYLRAGLKVGLPPKAGRMILALPWVVVRLLFVTLGGFTKGSTTWHRTRRSAEVV